MKALPHRSSNYFETVCCAGVGRDNRWRRLYPVPFRVLEDGQQFSRWHWVKYKHTPPLNDARRESQKVDPNSIVVGRYLKSSERSRLARILTREGTREAESLGETLALVRPSDVRFLWKRKTDEELTIERRKHTDLVSQASWLNDAAKPLDPCPFEFEVSWKDSDKKRRSNTCDDWETSAAFFNRRRSLGEEGALHSLKATYENEYPQRGMRLALGTHSWRKQTWLLVGLLRVDEDAQSELPL